MSKGLRVLIVDDQPAVVKALQVLLELNEIPSVGASTPREALKVAAGETLGVVIQDMNFSRQETSGEEGIDLFHTLRRAQPDLPVLLMTAWASLETAVEMGREGAVDYIRKPWDDERLVAQIRTVLERRQAEVREGRRRREAEEGRRKLEARHHLKGLVFASEAMHRLLTLALSVADSDAPVLVSGPSGSGKERIAEILQANSRRRDEAFVRVNVGAIPEELMESELFGAEPGAYTGARRRRIGHFETAHRGTLFLDEIDALSLAGQVKLLRVLQSGEFQRLGSSESRRVDVRVLSATNADLVVAMEEGRFREDLYFRLNVVELAVPPLEGRPADVLPLARHFLATHGERGSGALTLGEDAEEALLAHDWPGNVRELENRIHRAALTAESGVIDAEGLGLAGSRKGGTSPPGAGAPELSGEEEAERRDLLRALEAEHGVVTHAADRLGISRQALYRRMARLGVEIERRPKG